ncbi:MAG: outer membrane protein assembly factor BamA [Prevotellaceae bacterium]|jgi:outer membrane protein insertion porin family|nr:outer membrane protein assembly factor BamA [Prevotellaceae bacterium]
MFEKFLVTCVLVAIPFAGWAQAIDSAGNAGNTANIANATADSVAGASPEADNPQEAAVSSVQLSKDYTSPKKYVIADITISGVKYYNSDQIINISGFSRGDTITIPSDQISQSVKKFWANGMFSNVKLSAAKVVGDKITLDIYLEERPRIISYDIKGVKKGEKEDLQGSLHIRRGNEYSEYFKNACVDIIKRFYYEKGFRNVAVDATVTPDTSIGNGVRVVFEVSKNSKVRVAEIEFEGNSQVSTSKLRGAMKEVHRRRWYTFWRSTKYIQKKLEEDKQHILSYYNEKGYRDAAILSDSMWIISDKRVGLKFKVYEGQKYYFRNITWVGNTRYSSELLANILRLRRGDVYDMVALDKNLRTDETNSIATLYMDDGYLFFNVQPTEVRIEGDSVDVEMRIYEGKQATINNIFIQGNTKTNERIIRRELWTRPGDLFSKTQIMRSVRELAQMGHFDPEKLEPKLNPNPADETVDITYLVEEKPNDQIELSGGWGAGMFVGTIGLRLTNFAMGSLLDKEAWKPLPTGDNQTLTIRGQTNGSYYKAISTSFTEPWFGGKKPQSLSVSVYYTHQNNSLYFYQAGDMSMSVLGASVGLGQRLKWPDSYFTLYNSVDYQQYRLNNWTGQFIFTNGMSNNFSVKTVLGRNSTDQPIYPRKGSELSIGLQITPPYSLFNNLNYSDPNLTPQEKYRWIEYHKWSFRMAWFNQIMGDFVFALKTQFGYLGYFSQDLGYSPFEGFDVGGDGMSGYNLYGIETIGLRGYKNSSLTPYNNGISIANVYDKFTVELRYPFVLSPQSTIYGLVFFEGGNAWLNIKSFNPFSIKRSAGVGVRLMLPMIGLLGIDWGYGFDKIQGETTPSGSNFHFIIGMPF